MTMWRLSLRALETQILLFLLCAPIVIAGLTTTTTLTSTTTVLTSTARIVTVTTDGTTYASLTRATSTKKINSHTTTIATAATMSWGSGTGDYSTSELRLQVLNSTNHFRAQFQADALSWDPSLAQYAQRYVERCIWEHSVRIYCISRCAAAVLTWLRADYTARTWPWVSALRHLR